MHIVKLHDNRVTLINGDSAEIMKKIKAEIIDLTVTSPPYDDLRTYNGYSFDFETIAKELFRVTKVGGTVVWVVADSTKNGTESGTSLRQALYFKEIGFNLHDTMIYRRSTPPIKAMRYQGAFEFMFVFTKGKIQTFNPIMQPASQWTIDRRKTPHKKSFQRGKDGNFGKVIEAKAITEVIRTNVWDINAGYSNNASDEYANKHPAIFPEVLAYDHIISWSNENDVIFDPFLGSGTTAKMAIKLNRRFIGIELSAAYFNDIVIPRCNQAIGELVHDET